MTAAATVAAALLAWAVGPVVPPAAAPAARVSTPRGAEIEVIEERPAGPGPFPAVVLGSGSGYDMRRPILARVAEALVAAGVGVFRFDWAYRVRDPEHGKQSADRAAELEDMTAVLALARKRSWVDPSRLAVGGKSLGSIVAWQVLAKDAGLKGALLLTPVCNPKPAPAPKLPDANYPGVEREKRPSAWILGKSDPACSPTVLYRYLASAGGEAQIDVLRGDHSFEERAPDATAARDATVELAARLAADFARALLAAPAPAVAAPPAPRVYEYARRGETPLKLYAFSPEGRGTGAAILLLHSGGWTRSSPRGMFEAARRFSAAGLVAVAVEYRLSAGGVTPVEAFDDTCEAFRWVRAHAGELGVDPRRVAGYGASAGGVMVAAAATAGCAARGAARTADAASRPDALVLLSTGFDLERSETFRKLSRPGVDAAAYSPLAHVGSGQPPTFIAHGTEDAVTPFAAATLFCDRSRALGSVCQLQSYPARGHLLTTQLADQRTSLEPDPKAMADALDRQIRFLSTLGFAR